MRILEYSGLDVSRVRAAYARVRAAIEQDDFGQADVKKLTNVTHGKFYRAKLDYANRLLFCLVRHGSSTCALMLEVIENHAYEKSRFLRGATVDEALIPAADPRDAAAEAEAVRYLHPERVQVHLLDKVLSFDDVQDAVYRLPAPLILVGGAGSGKTALTLEKLKLVEGEVLFTTQSSYLAQSARDMYYSHGYAREGQEAHFLSYREFLESLRVPEGREAGWPDFVRWFARQQQAFKDIDAHQAFEEIRGVITAGAQGALSRQSYLALGVRQSIFAEEQRAVLYDLYERYLQWLKEARLYDVNLVAHGWHAWAAPRYDFVVIDELQDLTNAQLALVLKTLKKPGQFLLCGDSNQIVHPNFFAWSRVKTLFWQDAALADQQQLRVLRTNFRNSREATRIANTLLKLKQQRFGSIDRESNFLVDAVSPDAGAVVVLRDTDASKRDLNQKTRQSTRFAVLVMREENKAEARRYFQTPLVFSIQEAKGLEYENIVLYRFISSHRAEYNTVIEGIAVADLAGEELVYRRARDKSDRSLEIFKFHVNALYVALTRAVRNVYLIESDVEHGLLGLLGVAAAGAAPAIQGAASTLEDWQREARKLELQGKQEQAAAIRTQILKQVPVPWTVMDATAVRALMNKVFVERAPGGKPRQQLYEYAACHDDIGLARWLAGDGDYEPAVRFKAQRKTLGRKHYVNYFGQRFKDILQQCDRHGIDHRTPMNQTPLMAAAAAGNVPLAEALLERGANPDLTDHFGRNALHWAMAAAFDDAAFAGGAFAQIYERVAPAAIDVKIAERMVRIDRHLAEYFLFQTLWVLFKTGFHDAFSGVMPGAGTRDVLAVWAQVSPMVLRRERNQRAHVSGVLSRNEVERDYVYNRQLFLRVGHGRYQFNPALAVRVRAGTEERWVPILEALSLRLIAESSPVDVVPVIDALLVRSGLAPLAGTLAGDRLDQVRAREQAEREATLAAEKARERELARLRKSLAPTASSQPKWGTPAARQAEIERIRKEIEARAARENDAGDAGGDGRAGSG